MDDAVADVERALLAIDRAMRAVTPDDIGRPSPCEGWTVGRVATQLQRPGALDREVPGPGSRAVPMRMLLRVLPVEVLLHGWDIARGTGMSTDLDPQLAERLLEAGRPLIEQFGRGTAFGPEQPAPAGAPAADRLAAFYGRRVELRGTQP
jgi:hypothetical protein